MTLAPVVGLVLGAASAVVLALASRLATPSSLSSLLASTVVIAGLAYATRALHLDGLADTADALGSGKPREQALAIAKRSDIGPFGVIALVLTLGLQVVALALATERGIGIPAIVLAAVAGRVGLTWACSTPVPAARPDGLGALVAGTVSPWTAIAWTVVLVAAAALMGPGLLAGVAAGLATVAVFLRIAIRRLGGVTGDVLGAIVELATTSVLVVAAVV